MGKGGYFGGSTIIGPRSGWFSKDKKKENRKKKFIEKLKSGKNEILISRKTFHWTKKRW